MTYINKAIPEFYNWSIQMEYLILWSTLEFNISKKMERAMNQMEALYKEWHSSKVSLYERYKYSFFIKSRLYNEMIVEFANNYSKNGSLMTAASLL